MSAPLVALLVIVYAFVYIARRVYRAVSNMKTRFENQDARISRNERAIAELELNVDFSVRDSTFADSERVRLGEHLQARLRTHADPVRAMLFYNTQYTDVGKSWADYIVSALADGNRNAAARNLPQMTLRDAIIYVQRLHGIFAPGSLHALNHHYSWPGDGVGDRRFRIRNAFS